MLGSWGGVVARHPWRVLVASVVMLVLAAGYGLGVFDSLSDGGFEDSGSDSYRQVQAESDLFGNHAVDVVAIFSHDSLPATDPGFEEIVRTTLAGLPATYVTAVVTYYDTGLASLLSQDGSATQVLISLAGENQDEFLHSYKQIRPLLEADGLETEVTGSFSVFDDVNRITKEDLTRAELITIPIVLVLSFLIFGSVVAASMPLMVGLCSVVGGMAVVRLLAESMEISVFAVNVITLLGLGLAIDYALFIISRFREEMAVEGNAGAGAAVVTTMRTAGRTVLFSGLTVAAALSSLLVFEQAFLRSMAVGGMAAVTVAMIAAITVLPAALRLLGPRIDAGRLPGKRGRHVAVGSGNGAWARIAHAVMARPILVAVGVTAVMLLIASPFLGVKWGSVDYRVLPESAPSRAAADRLNTDFGPEMATSSIVLRDSDAEAGTSYVAALAAVPGVEDAQIVAATDDNTAFLIHATWQGNPMDQASRAIVKEIRAVDPGLGEVLVGGTPAFMVDLLASVGAQLPWMLLIVVAVMMVLLFLAFGSLVLPVKAIVMNAISITASFGVVTWIFADGHLEGLLGFTSQGFLDVTSPILMLAVLFGLSMDYEVFLLSRVREQWDKGHDNDSAVALGLQKTGRIITSAALLLAVVIGAFATSGIVIMKMIGVGMLVALLLDATVIRALLVPATMKLLGRHNWWAPGPMRRWWERYGIREQDEVESAVRSGAGVDAAVGAQEGVQGGA